MFCLFVYKNTTKRFKYEEVAFPVAIKFQGFIFLNQLVNYSPDILFTI